MIKFITILFLISTTSWAQEFCKDSKKCPDLKKFYDEYKESTVYIGLASPYVKNPASLFGHNFILVAKDDNLMDGFTFSFEAQNTASNGFEYITKGLSGGFAGKYVLRPIFSSIRLYNNFEDRNLYLYPLKLRVKEKNELISRIWHYAKNETRPYYFFTGNCAYFLYEFLHTSNTELHKPMIYFSPQETINRLSGKIDFNKIKTLASIKSEIKNISQIADPKQRKITKLYKDAKLQLYKKYRGKKNSYTESLLALNTESLESEIKVPKFKVDKDEAPLKPFSKLEIGSNFKSSKYQVSLTGVDNSYRDGSSISSLKLLGINFSNFNDNEYNFTLFNIYSKPSYESYFKDISWKAEARYLNSEYLYKYTTDLILGAGISLPLVNNLIFTVRPSLLTSKYRNGFKIQLITEIDIEYFYKSFNFISTYSKKYFNDSITLSIEYNLSKSIAINASYEKIKYYRETTLAGLAIRF